MIAAPGALPFWSPEMNGRYGPATVEVNEAGDLTLVSAPLAMDPNSPESGQAARPPSCRARDR